MAGKGKKAPAKKPTRAPRAIDRERVSAGERHRRVPLGIPELKMTARIRSGYIGRWINDAGGRIARAQQGGWEFALDHDSEEEDKRRSMVVGTQRDGQPLLAYLMEIREEFYDEDQALKQKPLDEMEAAMRRGTPHEAATGADRERFYVPDEGISIEH